jgi:DNA-binding response OmpR family regulator
MRSPVNPRELVARVKQILRKRDSAEGGSSGRLYVGELEIDPELVEVRKGGREVHLSPREFKLLYTLARSPGASSRAARSSGRCGARTST